MTILTPGDSLVATYLSLAGSTKRFVVTCGIAASGAPAIGVVIGAWRLAVTNAAGPFNAANMSVDWTMTRVYGLQNSGGFMTSAELLTPEVGTINTHVTPAPNNSVLVLKKTAGAGVRYRGRMSVPPCNIFEADIGVTGVIPPTPLSVQSDYWDYVYSTLVAGGYNPYLFHAPSKAGTAHPTTVPVRTPITGFEVSPLIGTNRRRLR